MDYRTHFLTVGSGIDMPWTYRPRKMPITCRWNQAQSSCNVCGMLSESDHGLSDTGREQSEQLGKTLANVKKDLQHGSLQAARAWERPWLERALSSSVVVCSPFTRALQTAIIALEDILRE